MRKVSGGVTTTYYIAEGQLMGEYRSNGTDLVYLYDENNQKYGLIYNGTYYYYIYNGQSDVIGLYDLAGNVVARYEYDAWGAPIAITNGSGTDVSADLTHIANINPIRYRGYYYDAETGLYSLLSRYYDPQTGRFINADNQIQAGSDMTGMNLFASCGNNPVNRVDSTGHAWYHWAIGAAIVVACAVAVVATAGGAAAAIAAVAAVGNGMAAATVGSTIAAGAFIGSATVYGVAAMSAAASSSSVKEFNNQGNWGTVAATAGGAVFGGASAYGSTKTPKTKVYRSVSSAEAKDIKSTGQFNLAPGGMESKQFGFNLAETRQFGNMMGQNTIVSAKMPTNMLGQFYTGGVDTSIFRGGTLTVYGDQLSAFNQAVAGTINIML